LVNGSMKKERNVRNRRPGVKVGENAWELTLLPGPPFLQYSVSRPQKSAFFRGNARSQAGKTVLFTGTQVLLVNLNLVKITA